MSLATDLVRDSRLVTQVLNDDVCVHTHYESDPRSRKRAVPRLEYWQRHKIIGRGSYGSVRLEKCVKGQRNGLEMRAVKQLSTARSPHSQPLDYTRELEAIAKFSQAKYERCFVRAFGWYEDNDSLFIAMEYLEHGDLHHYLAESPPLPELEAGDITFQILEGLSFMHENHFAHRDLKPANILLKSKPPDVWVKIGDFGLSKRVEDQLGLTNTLKGTYGFIAPELHGFLPRTDDYAPDIWALGEISFQMLTKKPTFRHLGLLTQYIHDETLLPESELRAHKASDWAIDFVRCSMKASPEERLTADDGLVHAWIRTFAPENPTPELPALQRRSTEKRRSTSIERNAAEDLGVWTAFSAIEEAEQSKAQDESRTLQPDPQTVKSASTPEIAQTSQADNRVVRHSSPPPPIPPRKPVPDSRTVRSTSDTKVLEAPQLSGSSEDIRDRQSGKKPKSSNLGSSPALDPLVGSSDHKRSSVRRSTSETSASRRRPLDHLTLDDVPQLVEAEQRKSTASPADSTVLPLPPPYQSRGAVDEVLRVPNKLAKKDETLGAARRESIQERQMKRETERPQEAPQPTPQKSFSRSWFKRLRDRVIAIDDKPRMTIDGDAIANRETAAIFGVPLRKSITYANVAISLKDDDGVEYIYGYVPIIVAKVVYRIKNEGGSTAPDIFKRQSSPKVLAELRTVFDTPPRYGKGLVWDGYTVYDAANILLEYFHSLPDPLVPKEDYHRWKRPLLELSTVEEQVKVYQTCITELPPINRQLLLYVLDFLSIFVDTTRETGVEILELAEMFENAILKPDYPTRMRDIRAEIIVLLIENQNSFFDGTPAPKLEEAVEAGAETTETDAHTLQTKVVFVSGIDSRTTLEEVRDFFGFCGKVVRVGAITTDGRTTVAFDQESAARTALLLDNTQLGPAQIRVVLANVDEHGYLLSTDIPTPAPVTEKPARPYDPPGTMSRQNYRYPEPSITEMPDQPPLDPERRTILVSGLAPETSTQDVHKFFEFCGKINYVLPRFAGNREAVVNFEHASDAWKALLVDGAKLGTSFISVKMHA